MGGFSPRWSSTESARFTFFISRGNRRLETCFTLGDPAGEEEFGDAIRVNGRPAGAMAIGTIRGGQLAVGEKGRVHVAWNGLPPRKGEHHLAPMLYTRLNDAGTAFEPERDLITTARGLDGGGSVAADDRGDVYVMWHAPKPGNTLGEAGRAVFVARSRDGGRTFAPERLAVDEPTGACGCCGMKALADGRGNLFVSIGAPRRTVTGTRCCSWRGMEAWTSKLR